MHNYMLCHRHESAECQVAFAAWSGFQSPLRHANAPCSCRQGEHRIWWRVEAPDPSAALALLPRFVAERTEAIEVRDVTVP
jgi:hypothetical protein